MPGWARPTTRFATNDGVNIAYQVIGDGPIDLVFLPGFVSHLDLAWDEPFLAAFLRNLAGFSRLIWFDKRGTGLSDPVDSDVAFEHRVDDLRAVMDAAESRRAALFGISEGAALSVLFAAEYPDRAAALVLWAGFARFVADDNDDAPGWTREFFEWFLDGLDHVRDERAGLGVADSGLGTPNPSLEGDEKFQQWLVRYVRAAAAPGSLRRVLASNGDIDIRPVLPDLRIRTLLMHRVNEGWIPVKHSRYLAAHIRDSTLIELPGVDHWPWLGDASAVLDEIEGFLLGKGRSRRSRPAWGVDSLTKREREVARLAVQGMHAAGIGARLGISERTVETHLANAYAKLGVASKVDLARDAADLGL